MVLGAEPLQGMDRPPADAEQIAGERQWVPRPHWRDIRLYSSPPGAPRFRRPTDVLLLVVSLVGLLVLGVAGRGTPAGFEAALVSLFETFPDAFEPLWAILFDLLLIWPVLLLVLCVARRRWHVALVLVLAALGAILGALALARAVTGSWPAVGPALSSTDEGPAFPAVRLALSMAVGVAASPHLARPFRRLGRWVEALGALAAFALVVATPWGVAAAAALGIAVGAGLHLLFGSPGGTPTADQVGRALADLGVDAVLDEPAELSAGGVSALRATDDRGEPLLVKVFGRDAWDAQLIATAWRFLWYRDQGPTLTLSRLQQVEREAFLLLLAERRGAPVTPVLAAGTSSRGDVLLAVEAPGVALAELDDLDDHLVAALWDALSRLHAAGVAHGRVEPGSVLVDVEGPHFADFGAAEVVADPEPLLIDRAQLLATTASVVGAERAVRAAGAALGPEGLAEITSYLQPAALTRPLRRALDNAHVDLDDLRTEAARAVGEELPELQQLRRLSWGRVLTGALLLVAAWMLVSNLTDIGIDNIVEAVQDASMPILVTALLLGQVPRVANAFSLLAAAPAPIPLGRVSALQFAITFVNLAMPSTAARVAVNIRFFQRAGLTPSAALTSGAIDSVSGFIVQILLLVGIPLLGLGTLRLDVTSELDTSSIATMVLVIVVVVVVALAVVLLVPALRRRVLDLARELLGHVRAIGSPARIVQLVGANLTAELLFSLTMYTVLLAYGQHVSYADVVLINVGVALFAGLMPVPGGIGVTEAALTAGFVAIGVPDAIAFAAAISYRMCTFYLPPIWGFVAFRWLQRRRYL